MIVLEDERGVLAHLLAESSAYRTACGIPFRLVERNDSSIELMTPARHRPITCLWCARARTRT